MNAPTRRWWTIAETAQALGLSVSGARKLANRGDLPLVHLAPRVVRVDGHELTRRLDEQLKRAASAR